MDVTLETPALQGPKGQALCVKLSGKRTETTKSPSSEGVDSVFLEWEEPHSFFLHKFYAEGTGTIRMEGITNFIN